MKKATEPRYLPLVALGRLKTATTYEEVRQQLKGQTYDPGAVFSFPDEQVEVVEVVQEEVDNIDKAEVQKAIRQAEDARHDKRRRRRMNASKGSKYRKRYF